MFLPFRCFVWVRGLATSATTVRLSHPRQHSTSPTSRVYKNRLLYAPLFVLILPKASSFAQITVRCRKVRFKVAELGWHRLTSCPIPAQNVMIRP